MSADERVAEIVRDTPWLMDALQAAREVNAPDWVIGAVRTAVWDRLHGFTDPTELADVDVAFFDPDDLSRARDEAVESALCDLRPDVEWDARNQAAVHLWYPARFGYDVPPLRSTEDGIASWPETATCVGVRLEDDERVTVVAPLGTGDLLDMVYRRNPVRVSVEEYKRRLRVKRIAERWPRVRIER
jgi:uncharacterized protein